MRRAYRDEFDASDASVEGSPKNVYLSAEGYAAYMVAMNSGRIKIMRDNVEAIENEAAMRRAVKSYRFSSAH